jgi:hypothetical protein
MVLGVHIPLFQTCSFPFLKGWPGLVPDCARRTTIVMVPHSLLIPLLKGAVWIYPLLRALTEHGP